MIAVSCPCGKRLKAPEALAGRRVRCPGCGNPLTVPAEKTEAIQVDQAALPPPDPPPLRRTSRRPAKRPRRWLPVAAGLFLMLGSGAFGAWWHLRAQKSSLDPLELLPASPQCLAILRPTPGLIGDWVRDFGKFFQGQPSFPKAPSSICCAIYGFQKQTPDLLILARFDRKDAPPPMQGRWEGFPYEEFTDEDFTGGMSLLPDEGLYLCGSPERLKSVLKNLNHHGRGLYEDPVWGPLLEKPSDRAIRICIPRPPTAGPLDGLSLLAATLEGDTEGDLFCLDLHARLQDAKAAEQAGKGLGVLLPMLLSKAPELDPHALSLSVEGDQLVVRFREKTAKLKPLVDQTGEMARRR